LSRRPALVRTDPALPFGLFLPPAPATAQPPKKIDFVHDIVPILKARCAECHTNGTYKSGLSLDTREALLKTEAVVPRKSAASELLKRVRSGDKDFLMPPQGPPLSPRQIALPHTCI